VTKRGIESDIFSVDLCMLGYCKTVCNEQCLRWVYTERDRGLRRWSK